MTSWAHQAHWWFSPLLVSFSHHFLRESFPIKISWQKPKSSLCNELQLAKIPCAILLGVWRKRPQEVAINTEPVNNNFQCSQGTLCLPSSLGTPAPRSWAWVCKCHFSVTATQILNKNDQYHSLDHSHPYLYRRLLPPRKARVYTACWPGIKALGRH